MAERFNSPSESASSGVPAKSDLYQGIRDILLAARNQVRQTVNTAMVQTYWQIGRLIVEGEQGGSAEPNTARLCCLSWPSG